MKTISILGGGNMGVAMAKALHNDYDVTVIHPSEKNKSLLNNLKIKWKESQNNIESNFLIVAVKPQIISQVFTKLKIKSIIISIAAGVSIKKIKSLIDSKKNLHVVRAMPNIAVSICKGTTAICKCNSTTEEEFLDVKEIFNKMGKTVEIDETKIDVATALSGSSPAYVFLMLSAMVNFGIDCGLNFKKSLELSGYSLIGSLKLALKSEKTPKDLIEMVCSPKGTTIEAINCFKENKFETIIKAAMTKCKDRAKKLNL